MHTCALPLLNLTASQRRRVHRPEPLSLRLSQIRSISPCRRPRCGLLGANRECKATGSHLAYSIEFKLSHPLFLTHVCDVVDCRCWMDTWSHNIGSPVDPEYPICVHRERQTKSLDEIHPSHRQVRKPWLICGKLYQKKSAFSA